MMNNMGSKPNVFFDASVTLNNNDRPKLFDQEKTSDNDNRSVEPTFCCHDHGLSAVPIPQDVVARIAREEMSKQMTKSIEMKFQKEMEKAFKPDFVSNLSPKSYKDLLRVKEILDLIRSLVIGCRGKNNAVN